MGRPPCCDKVGIKKGPWTPEEDIILVSYIQEHGPGNWRSVPTNTGLMRCSKSCRLRWTNYLRPGIKRGNFTPHEEGMIIHLQALLGNKWAAIASYLPQRTDNDIKNYWNTHLKKKIKKFQTALDPQMAAPSDSSTYNHQFVSSNSFIDRRPSTMEDITSHTSNLRFNHGTSTTTTTTTTTYASSTENISRLLEGWMRSSPKPNPNSFTGFDDEHKVLQQLPNCSNFEGNNGAGTTAASLFHSRGTNKSEEEEEGEDDDEEEDECHLGSNDELESILSFDNMNNIAKWDNSSYRGNQTAAIVDHDKDNFIHDQRKDNNNHEPPPLSFLENWLLGESGGQVEEMMELPPIF